MVQPITPKREVSEVAHIDDIWNRNDHSVTTMNFVARHIKLGQAFKLNIDLTIAAGATEHIVFETNDRVCSVFNQQIYGRALDMNVVHKEGVSYDSVAGLFTPINVNRLSDNGSNCVGYNDVTNLNGGVEIDSAVVLSEKGLGNRINPASDISVLGWVLKPNTSYGLSFTNNNGSSVTIKYEFEWYETDLDKTEAELLTE